MNACERYLTAINELVDGSLGPLRRAELELHLETCEGCSALARDLQRIAQTGRALERLEPPDGVWGRISAALQAEGRIPAPRPARWQRGTAVLALAAALVIAVTASTYFLTRGERRDPEAQAAAGRQQPGTEAPPAAAAGPAAEPYAAMTFEMELAEKHFQNVLREADAVVDPRTLTELQKNLLVVSDALAESRKVLETDPQNLPARQSFYDTLRQKIQFLQDTVALMNQMRQGNAAGAAQIVEGGKS